MKVKELKEILTYYEDNVEVRFEDVCSNWLFEIYQAEEHITENGIISLVLIGDEE